MVWDDDLQADFVYNRNPLLTKFVATQTGPLSECCSVLLKFPAAIQHSVTSQAQNLAANSFRIVQRERLQIPVVPRT